MAGVVADTHAAVWYLLSSPRLSGGAASRMRSTIAEGASVYVSAITLVELVYLVEKGRLSSVALERLTGELSREDSGLAAAPLDLAVANALRRIPRNDVPDMPDRIIAATALSMGLPLITRDGKIRVSGVETVW
jgi:PIN domain nuclease of toxin-antitoxin system